MTQEVKIWIKDNRDMPPFWQRIAQVCIATAILFGPGILADSAAMQWAGFLLFLAALAMALFGKDFEAMTISKAKERLAEIEAKDAK